MCSPQALGMSGQGTVLLPQLRAGDAWRPAATRQLAALEDVGLIADGSECAPKSCMACTSDAWRRATARQLAALEDAGLMDGSRCALHRVPDLLRRAGIQACSLRTETGICLVGSSVPCPRLK